MYLELGISLFIILLAMYGLCISDNIIKSIVFVNTAEAAVILFFLGIVRFEGARVPIVPEPASQMVDPLPQALMITAIVIGAAVTALTLMMTIKLFHHYGTIQWKELLRKEG